MGLTRTQAVVIAFFWLAWFTVTALALAAPATFSQVLPGSWNSGTVRGGFVAALGVLLAALSYGVVQRWRWLFWLLLLAFAAGILRVIDSGLVLGRALTSNTPQWYVTLQALIGVVQVAIAGAMYAGYRRSGPWGSF